MNCYNFIIEYQNNGQYGHEVHQLTLQEGERFVGFAMVIVNEKDEKESVQPLKPIDDESRILIQ